MPPWEKYQTGQRSTGPWEKYGGGEGRPGGLAFMNRGIANVLGAPVDLMNTGLSALGMETSDEPFLGSRNIESGMESIGVDLPEEGQQPETLGEYIGRGTGEAAGAMVPFSGIARGMQAASGPLKRGVGETLMRPYVSTPVRAAATETAAGAGAGTGAHVAENLDPDSAASRFMAELGGGLAAAAGPGAAWRGAGAVAKRTPVAGSIMRAGKAAVVPFTEAGGRVRASNRMRGLSGDPEGEAAALEQPSIGGLSPAQQTGNPRLMALERAVMDKDATLSDEMQGRMAESTQTLRGEMREPAGGAGASEAQSFIGQRHQQLLNRLDERVNQAETAAQERIEKLSPERRASESSSIVRDEMESALKTAREEENRLWSAIPDEAQVPTQNARQAYKELRDDLPRAQRDDIPDKARRFLDEESNERLKDADTVREVRGLYSALRESSRQARANGNFNEARIADRMGDAILEDLGAVADTQTDVGRLFNEARSYSAALNERFRQGAPGRVLGYAREGGAATPPETTLDMTIGRGGTKAAVEADELRRAAEGSADADAAMQDYLRRRFSDYTIRNGQFGAQRAQDFVTRNDELLDRFPALKQQMQDAEQARSIADRSTRTAGQRAKRLRDPKQSRAASFLNAPLEQEFDTVLRARDPRSAAAELKRQVSRDDSGQALAGLKGAFFDYLTRQAKTGQFDEMGQNVLSGRRMQNVLSDARTRAAAEELFEPEEMQRLERIVQEFRSLESAQGRLPNVGEEVMGDEPLPLISILMRTVAARVGAQAGAGTSGASLLTAHFASKRMKDFLSNLTNDRAEALIKDAIQDKDLFQSLLRGIDSPDDAKQVERRLIEWMEGYAGTEIGETSREMEGASDEQQQSQASPLTRPGLSQAPDTRTALAQAVMNRGRNAPQMQNDPRRRQLEEALSARRA